MLFYTSQLLQYELWEKSGTKGKHTDFSDKNKIYFLVKSFSANIFMFGFILFVYLCEFQQMCLLFCLLFFFSVLFRLSLYIQRQILVETPDIETFSHELCVFPH